MRLLNDTEKVQFLIDLFGNHMEKIPSENSFRDYIESIQGFLKTHDSILQKAAISNSILFFENLEHSISEIDSIISYFERYLEELEAELQEDLQNQFLKGKIKGVKHALVIVRMMRQGRRYQGEGVNIIID
ncbi:MULTISPECIES: hypothetical protein [Paenibacillus]|uniref:hypothetical protein n=1 Tax=Paenibacillus TaxID=44249 RepID=UPI000953C506|nr:MULTISPECIES: hypothetical protein [Paenibacillus]ASS68156.1 hypothetical protein CIC07_19970 [Paenibacillus sp. RUD330]MEC0246356.1 hypothetical protein [Paenibacillus chitinolyticus]SIR69251.1 hypothetical protein SAMN05880555_4754 [Paenibacillus sp. RU4X]SIR76571.1 hypothetical protein SAMN05880570_4756 [Paenibacillus sp. RU4T]